MLLAILLVLGSIPASAIAVEERASQDVSAVISATLAQLAATVTEPAFGTNAGEWTVFSLARGDYIDTNASYFGDYYARIVEYVNTTAAALNKSGALDKNKSTDNSRLIMALSAIGKDATSVGAWDLVEAYSANGLNWICKQGMNGTIWTLIALDCGGYETSDPTIRQKCVDAILAAQHNDGGWSLITAKTQPSNVDITGMTLTALYPYRDQPDVAAACESALNWLSNSQLDNGGFPYGRGETSESCVWAIVAATTWGINPDTDPRFIKNGKSAIDNLLTYYIPEEARFAHERGAGSNAMATDQASYALIAYDRFIKGKPALYDYSDVSAENQQPAAIAASLQLPVAVDVGVDFGAVICVDNWDNAGGFKLIDMVLPIPEGLVVRGVAAAEGLSGGTVQWNVEEATGKLRVVYFDANGYGDLTITGKTFPAELFRVSFQADVRAQGKQLSMGITGMSVKRNANAEDEAAMTVINTDNATASVSVVDGVSFSAKCLYTGDDIDLISSGKKAVAIAVTGIAPGMKLSYQDDSNAVVFKYSSEISEKSGIATYVALVDAGIPMGNFVNENYLSILGSGDAGIVFGDTNGDGVVNTQDALAVVDAWLRKGAAPTDDKVLAMNVNGDSRINTFDALGIVEAFVNKTEYGIITKAAAITGEP